MCDDDNNIKYQHNYHNIKAGYGKHCVIIDVCSLEKNAFDDILKRHSRPLYMREKICNKEEN